MPHLLVLFLGKMEAIVVVNSLSSIGYEFAACAPRNGGREMNQGSVSNRYSKYIENPPHRVKHSVQYSAVELSGVGNHDVGPRERSSTIVWGNPLSTSHS